jgi:hypothetical protein
MRRYENKRAHATYFVGFKCFVGFLSGGEEGFKTQENVGDQCILKIQQLLS